MAKAANEQGGTATLDQPPTQAPAAPVKQELKKKPILSPVFNEDVFYVIPVGPHAGEIRAGKIAYVHPVESVPKPELREEFVSYGFVNLTVFVGTRTDFPDAQGADGYKFIDRVGIGAFVVEGVKYDPSGALGTWHRLGEGKK